MIGCQESLSVHLLCRLNLRLQTGQQESSEECEAVKTHGLNLQRGASRKKRQLTDGSPYLDRKEHNDICRMSSSDHMAGVVVNVQPLRFQTSHGLGTIRAAGLNGSRRYQP